MIPKQYFVPKESHTRTLRGLTSVVGTQLGRFFLTETSSAWEGAILLGSPGTRASVLSLSEPVSRVPFASIPSFLLLSSPT